MYNAHPSSRLHALFLRRPYQDADPATAGFVFFGLDANYSPHIEDRSCFPEIVSYLEDGVEYWRQRCFHHPFRDPSYRGDGALYHRRFAEIGFTSEHAEMVSFVELVDAPTCGRGRLVLGDLRTPHLDRLCDWVLCGQARFFFMPAGVARLLRRTAQFPGCRRGPFRVMGRWRSCTGRKAGPFT